MESTSEDRVEAEDLVVELELEQQRLGQECSLQQVHLSECLLK